MDKRISSLCSALFSLLLSLPGCAPTGTNSVSPHAYPSAAAARAAVASGPARVLAVSQQLEETGQEFSAYAKREGPAWRKRGYMTAAESDRMEHLLFRDVTGQDVLADLVGSLGGKQPAKLFPDESLKTAAHVLATDALCLLMHHRAQLVASFNGDPVAVAKLNEAFYRSEIPRGTFDRYRLTVTSPEAARRLEASRVLFQHDRNTPELQRLVANDSNYAALVARVPGDHRRAATSLAAVHGNALVEELEHSEAAKLARRAKGGWGDFKYKTRCLLFKDVSRIKNPSTKVIVFSSAQHAEVAQLLRPGDIILTYTAGYMSDVFIPGSFKHGMTYIGTPAQRKAAGMTRGVDQSTLPDGRPIDVIEAVAEGVIFNNLAYLMDTHVNRMVVLRPRYGSTERAAYLNEVASYLGDSYDFLFDFADASRQVCTEVIYRGMNGRSGIGFPLTRRGGHPTLSADDVVNYHFKTGGKHFEVVLFAEEAPSSIGHRAVVHTRPTAEQKLKEPMSGENSHR